MFPKYFKLSQTKTQSRILKVVISLTGDRWDYLLRAAPLQKKFATPQVGGNTCLTRSCIYISYSLKTSSQGHNLELNQPHKHINWSTRRMAKLKIHQQVLCHKVMKSVIYIGALVIQTHCHNLQVWKRAFRWKCQNNGQHNAFSFKNQSHKTQICILWIITHDSFLAIWVFTFCKIWVNWYCKIQINCSNSH